MVLRLIFGFRHFLLAAIVVGAPATYAQDFQSVIEDFRKEYSRSENLHIVMDIEVFDDSISHDPYFSEHAELRRKGINYRYSLVSNELLMNESYIVVVNKSNKEIIYSQRDLNDEKGFRTNMLLSIDSVLMKLGRPRLLYAADHQLHYRVQTKHEDISAIDIIFNSQVKAVKELRYSYRDGQIARIHFRRFDLNPFFEDRTFSEENFISINNNRVTVPQHLPGYIILQP